MWSTFVRWLLQSGVPLAIFRTAAFLGVSLPDGTIRALGGIVPRLRTTVSINEAIALAKAIGADAIRLEPVDYTVTPGTPIAPLSGVSIRGSRPFCTRTGNFSENGTFTGGTRIIGNGTTRGLAFNADDRAQPNYLGPISGVGSGYPIAGGTPNGIGFTVDGLAEVEISGMVFIGCTEGIAIGAKNAAGAMGCYFDNLDFQDCTIAGFRVENYACCTFGDLNSYSFQTITGNVNLWFRASLDSRIWEPGNSKYNGRGFVNMYNIRARGVVFEAYNLGILNAITLDAWQSDRFTSTFENYNLTFPAFTDSDKTSITVADSSKFPPNFPVVLTAVVASSGFVANPVYFANATDATHITLSNRPGGPAVAVTGGVGGAGTCKTQGYALFEVVATDPGSSTSFTHSSFTNLDLEGNCCMAFLGCYGVENKYEITQAATGQYFNIVLRNTQQSKVIGGWPLTTDFDSSSNDTLYTGFRTLPIDSTTWAGWGTWRDSAQTNIRGVLTLAARNIGPAFDLQAENYSGVAAFLRASQSIIGVQNFFTLGVATLSWANAFGTMAYNGTVANAGTLEDVTFGLPATNVSLVGAKGKIVHAGTGVLKLGSTDGALFNLKTGVTAAYCIQGQSISFELCKSSTGTLYYDVQVLNVAPSVQTVTGAAAAGTTQLTSDPSDGLCTISGTSLTTYTVTLPTEAKSVIGQRRRISFLTAVTTLTINGATTIYNAPSPGVSAGDTYEVVKVAANTWSFLK